MSGSSTPRPAGLLGDTSARDYAAKLQRFNAFAEPELRQAIATLDLVPGMRVLDAGCGTGEALEWLSGHVRPGGTVVGLDLAAAHLAAARRVAPAQAQVVQGDLLRAPFADARFDVVWCVNTIHHLRDPVAGVAALTRLLRPGGRIACGQSALLPELLFAWDSRLERRTHDAVGAYYRDRYQLGDTDLTGVRSVFGLLRRAGLANVGVTTSLVERVSPLGPTEQRYLLETIFRGTWGARLQPYLSVEEFAELQRLCDPDDQAFALRRPDFHFIQSFTLAVGQVTGR